MKRVFATLVCLLLLLSIFLIQFNAIAATQTKPPMTQITLPPINPGSLITPTPALLRPTKGIHTINPDLLATPTPAKPTPTLFRPTKGIHTLNPDLLATPTPAKPTPIPTEPRSTNPPPSTEKAASGQNICSMGLYFREMRPILTDEWYFFTPIEINYDSVQVFPLIASNTYEVGELTLTIENGQLLAEYWVLDGIKITDEFLTFFPNLDSVKTVNVQMLGGQEFPFNKPIDIGENFGDDTKVILYMNNFVKYNSTVPGLKHFVVDEYRPWMWEVMNLLD